MVAKVLYGSGLRLSKGLKLGVKDVDFSQGQITVRDAKGQESRVIMLPKTLVEPLTLHLQAVRQIHQQDLEQGYGSVYLPYALERKYRNAEREWIWQYVFPADRRSIDPRSGACRRHHLHESGLQKAVKGAVQQACIQKRRFRLDFDTPKPRDGREPLRHLLLGSQSGVEEAVKRMQVLAILVESGDRRARKRPFDYPQPG